MEGKPTLISGLTCWKRLGFFRIVFCRSTLRSRRIWKEQCHSRPEKHIFCKSLPFLRCWTFCLAIFWRLFYNSRRQLIFSLVRRRWSQHRRREHCHSMSMTALVSIVSDNTLCVSSIHGNQHLYGKIAITPRCDDGSPLSSFSFPSTPRIEKHQLQTRLSEEFWDFTYLGIAMSWLCEMSAALDEIS